MTSRRPTPASDDAIDRTMEAIVPALRAILRAQFPDAAPPRNRRIACPAPADNEPVDEVARTRARALLARYGHRRGGTR